MAVVKSETDSDTEHARYAFIAICVIAAIAFGVLFWMTTGVVKKSNDNAKDIQAERKASVIRSCRDQNERHHDAVTELDRLLKESGVTKARRAQSRKVTIRFIDALVPLRPNCIAYANKIVGNIVPTTPDKNLKPLPRKETSGHA